MTLKSAERGQKTAIKGLIICDDSVKFLKSINTLTKEAFHGQIKVFGGHKLQLWGLLSHRPLPPLRVRVSLAEKKTLRQH